MLGITPDEAEMWCISTASSPAVAFALSFEFTREGTGLWPSERA